MKKIVIFGATGNVGSYLTKYASEFFKDQFEVIAVGKRPSTNVFSQFNVPYYSVDISKMEEFAKLPTEDIHAVMLLAAQIPSYMDKYDGRLYVNSIILGSFNVLEWCRKVHADRILYTTTVFDVSLSASQEHAIMPNEPKNFSYTGDHAMYVIAKNTALEFIEHYHEEYGLKKFIFRLPTIYSYSPYHFYYPNGIKTKRPIYTMIEKALNGDTLEVWGDPNYAKDMVHVYDFSQELCLAATVDRDEGFYNIGTGMPITLDEQIKTIAEVFAGPNGVSPIVYKPEKPSGGGFLMNIDNAISELGYKPQYDCRKLFEDYKYEMSLDRFAELRIKN